MQENTDLCILTTHMVQTLLHAREQEIMQSVLQAYEYHQDGKASLPYSTFLHFPTRPKNRIIALPAFLGEDFDIAGLKWIASFPDNYALGLERASAVILLNSAETGRPVAILEGSRISMARTAASAALAAQVLHTREQMVTHLGLIGCGIINFEIMRFLRVVFPTISHLSIYDLNDAQTRAFRERCQAYDPSLHVTIVATHEHVFQSASLISFATTAAKPYLTHLPPTSTGYTILHISLRDLAPELILSAENIVDDSDHVARERTSIHLTETQVGNRDFIRGTLVDVIRGTAVVEQDPHKPIIFSPFGLGVLDLAVSKLVYEQARAEESGIVIPAFLPPSLQSETSIHQTETFRALER